ncbi:pkd2 [Symbiodinium sp. CCMP2456]|nr:pkd2 [Symbiodinium sp. CCMP2456]
MTDYADSKTFASRAPGASSGPWQARFRILGEVHALVQDTATWYRGAQWICFWYMLILLVKFGEGLPVSPQLMIFVNTLSDAVGSIFYFFIVFFVVFANFAMGAHFLFGHILYSWSTTFLPFASSMRVLMGDFDFMGMYDIAPVSSVSWFMLFTVMVVFVLVNLFIAIVTDSYQRVHRDTVGSPHEDMLINFAKTMTSVGNAGATNMVSTLEKLKTASSFELTSPKSLSKLFSERGSLQSSKKYEEAAEAASPVPAADLTRIDSHSEESHFSL